MFAIRSDRGCQLAPESVDRQTPPATPPAYMVEGVVGWMTRARVRPPTLPGPSACQAPSVPAAGGGGGPSRPRNVGPRRGGVDRHPAHPLPGLQVVPGGDRGDPVRRALLQEEVLRLGRLVEGLARLPAVLLRLLDLPQEAVRRFPLLHTGLVRSGWLRGDQPGRQEERSERGNTEGTQTGPVGRAGERLHLKILHVFPAEAIALETPGPVSFNPCTEGREGRDTAASA